MAYAAWSVTFGEQPTATKWNILGSNDASFNDGTGIADLAIHYHHLEADVQSGWIGAGETWTYASATTFTISGDKTSKYSVGMKLKLTNNSAVKYFWITAISYSAPNTTVTISGEVTLANSAITLNYFSFGDSPVGFKGQNYFKARAHIAAASQSINDNTQTLITFDTEDYDNNSNYNNSGGNYKYVAPVTGYYFVGCNVQISDATGKVVSTTLTMFIDATASGAQSQIPYPGLATAGAFSMAISQVVYLTAGQAVSFKATCDTSDSGAAEVLGGVNGSYCSFQLMSI